jgi:hypothetical protein
MRRADDRPVPFVHGDIVAVLLLRQQLDRRVSSKITIS